MPWRANGPALALVFFGLTCAATAAAWASVEAIIGAEKVTSWIVALAAITAAEMLIRKWRFFGSGVESALFISGLFCAIFGLPGEGSREVLLLFAAASAAAGLRMRNPFFGALAAAFVLSWLDSRALDAVAATGALTLAAIALAAGAREWRRPSTDMLWTVLLVIPPIGAAIATADELSPWWAAAYGAFAAVSFLAGLRLRLHPPLIAAGVNAVIATAILAHYDLLPSTQEWRLMAGGSVLLAASAAASRLLRDRTRGIVVTADALTAHDDDLEILATLSMQPKAPETAAGTTGGGRFGGAGSTGSF